MEKIFFAGHNNFGNRGCEALIRSVSQLIRREFPQIRFVTPSYAPDLDLGQWTDADTHGIELVLDKFPKNVLWWDRFNRAIPLLGKFHQPIFRLSSSIEKFISESDLLIMTGGDNLSLDYGLSSLYYMNSYTEFANSIGIPTLLWGASVGPFSKIPYVEQYMRDHLAKYSLITVRETDSKLYLENLGIKNVELISDPAFVLEPEFVNLGNMLPKSSKGIVGLNLSPLLHKFLETKESKPQFDSACASFIEAIVDMGYGVVLVPHVVPLDGSIHNNDHHYLLSLVDKCSLHSPMVKVAPKYLNAPQLKGLISKLRFFIGARTHSTIAALSSQVPTMSISYSAKAIGINRDLFGDLRFVTNSKDVSLKTLLAAFEILQKEEAEVRNILSDRIPLWKERAAIPVEMLHRFSK